MMRLASFSKFIGELGLLREADHPAIASAIGGMVSLALAQLTHSSYSFSLGSSNFN
jgi:hypothetical protein